MKRLKKNRNTAAGLLAGVMAMGAALFTACDKNVPETVYGPPEWFDPTIDPGSNVQEDVYGPPEYFNPTDEEPEDIEIPVEPEDGGKTPAPDPAQEGGQQPGPVQGSDPGPQTAPDQPPYDPNANIQEPVYGPPEWFDPNADPDGPAVPVNPEYDPDGNIPVTVYGPPEWFETPAPENPDETETPAEGTQTGSRKNSDEDDNKPAPQTPAEPVEADPGDAEEPAEPADPEEPAPEEPKPDIIAVEPVPFDPEINRPICMYGPPEWFNPDWGKQPVEPIDGPKEPVPEEPIPVPEDPTLVGE